MISEDERRELANRKGITALEHFLSILRDPKATFRQKLDAAKAAAPYMHRKMPTAVEVEDPVYPISVARLHRLTKPELLLLRTLLEKAGIREELQADDAL